MTKFKQEDVDKLNESKRNAVDIQQYEIAAHLREAAKLIKERLH